MKLGQSGANIKLESESSEAKFSKERRDDDIYCKFTNTIYYNPRDPLIFVEKRFGMERTVNVGKPAGMAIYRGYFIYYNCNDCC